jgi:hypothetical protein
MEEVSIWFAKPTSQALAQKRVIEAGVYGLELSQCVCGVFVGSKI